MKKILALVLALVLAVSFAACGQKEPLVGPGTENPMTECASLDEINAAAGTNIVKPGVMGVSEEKFFTVKTGDRTIAEYRFDLNGISYTVRSAAIADQDISGYYVDGEPAFGAPTGGVEYAEAEDVKLARFFDLNGQTVIAAKGDIESAIFEGIVAEMQQMSAANGGENGNG